MCFLQYISVVKQCKTVPQRLYFKQNFNQKFSLFFIPGIFQRHKNLHANGLKSKNFELVLKLTITVLFQDITSHTIIYQIPLMP